MKVLCVCRGGNSRSVVMAYVLKQMYGHDALSCGYRYNSNETLHLLCAWADIIVAMTEYIATRIPIEYHSKMKVIDVGSDIWFKPDKKLIEMCRNFWDREGV